MPALVLTMLLAGIGIPILAALNSALGQRLGSPIAAATVLFAVALAVSAAALLVTGPSALTKAPNAPRHLFLGGVLVAFYVIAITFIAPRIGVGNAVFFVLLGQLISAGLIDHFGLFGAPTDPISVLRASGIVVMAAGVWLTQMA